MRSQDVDVLQHSVWIVEDNDQFRKQLKRILNSSGVFLCEGDFRTCEPMLELVRESSPPDLVLMDIGLPGMNGIEGIRRIKAIAPSTEVVVLTVFDDNENVVHAIAAGAVGYLHKSSSMETIVESLKSILVGGAPINPHIARKVLELFASSSLPKEDYGLTRREKQILSLLIEDIPLKQVADRLSVSIHTVNMHLRNTYGKLQVQSRSGAVAKALKEHLL
jgi:DNA-binding NarL/FixJ family response regulator